LFYHRLTTQLMSGKIDPKRAIPRAEHERTAKVFVGGLAPTVTSESLKEFLGQFGGVMDATVMFDRETGRSKGFAFATFASEDSVGVAMSASGIELEGKQVGRSTYQGECELTRLRSRSKRPNLEVRVPCPGISGPSKPEVGDSVSRAGSKLVRVPVGSPGLVLALVPWEGWADSTRMRWQ